MNTIYSIYTKQYTLYIVTKWTRNIGFLVKFRKRGNYEIKSTFIKNRTYSYI